MTLKHLVVVGLSAALGLTAWFTPRVDAAADQNDEPAAAHHDEHRSPVGLVRVVRTNTAAFRNVKAAEEAGYVSMGSCVTGPERGAMGVHFANSELLQDDTVDARTPELLVYEPRGDRFRLVAVEFIVIADAWNNSHPDGAPPVLMGQHFQLVPAPNRYRLPAFYELHVWAWRENRFGTFVDWNPAVTCAAFDPGDSTQ